MIKNETQNDNIKVKEERQYNIDLYLLLDKLTLFEEKHKELKVKIKDTFPCKLIISGETEIEKEKLIIIYDQQEFFETEIIPEIITRYCANTITKDSYYEDNKYTAIMENSLVLQLDDLSEKKLNKLLEHIEKIQERLQNEDEFEYKMRLETEKEELRGLNNPEGSSNILVITLTLIGIIALAIIIYILIKNT